MLDGDLTEWYENGQKLKEAEYKDGLLDGDLTEWYENGQKLKEVEYKEDKTSGDLTSWYENGQKEIEAEYKDGLLNGDATLWYEKGQKQEEAEYKDDKLHGDATLWYENGKKKSVNEYKDGLLDGRQTSWYDNGKKKSIGFYKNGLRDGRQNTWRETGEKESLEIYKDDVLIALPNCEGRNTKKWSGCIGTEKYEEDVYEGEYYDGLKNGNGKYTWSDGTVYEGNWVNDVLNGNGKYTWSDGVVYEGNWVNGDMNGYGTWTEPGEYVYVGEFKDGEFTGQGIRTYKDGTVEEGIFFEDDFISKRKTPSSKTPSDFQITAISDTPSTEDILNALYGVPAMRGLATIDIISTDGFNESEAIYVSQVKIRIKEIQMSDDERDKILVKVLIEGGANKAEAEFYVALMAFNNGITGLMGLSGDGSKGSVSTEILRFGKGNNGWIYLPEEEVSNTSGDSYYETDFQGWVDKYGYPD